MNICERTWSTSMEVKPMTSNSSINCFRASGSRWVVPTKSWRRIATIVRCNDDKTPFQLKAKKDKKTFNYVYDCIIKRIERVWLVSLSRRESLRRRDRKRFDLYHLKLVQVPFANKRDRHVCAISLWNKYVLLCFCLVSQ